MDVTKQGPQQCFSRLKWQHSFQKAVVCRPLEPTLVHILVFRRLALVFFGAGNTAAVEQTFVERGFTGGPEERAARLGFLFSLWIR